MWHPVLLILLPIGSLFATRSSSRSCGLLRVLRRKALSKQLSKTLPIVPLSRAAAHSAAGLEERAGEKESEFK